MTKLVILSSAERPPRLKADERTLYFSLTQTELKIIQELRTITNKVGFVLQSGYFKANAKFYTAEQFWYQDIHYVANVLGVSSTDLCLSTYQKKIPTDHRKRILAILGWRSFDSTQQDKVTDYIKWLTQRQLSPRHVFLSIIDFCWQNKIKLPSYNMLANSITNAYNHFEQNLIDTVANKLTYSNRTMLDQLVCTPNRGSKRKPPKFLSALVDAYLPAH